jgi:hypothetical protein
MAKQYWPIQAKSRCTTAHVEWHQKLLALSPKSPRVVAEPPRSFRVPWHDGLLQEVMMLMLAHGTHQKMVLTPTGCR